MSAPPRGRIFPIPTFYIYHRFLDLCMPFDLELFSGKIRRLVSQLQVDIDDFSLGTGISLPRLRRILKADLEPSGDEVLIFADFFKVDFKYFISNQVQTAAEQVDILYRSHGSDFSPEDRWAIQEFLFLCECEAFVMEKLLLKRNSFRFSPRGKYLKGHGEEAAASMRAFLGLSKNMVVADPYDTFRKLGFHIFRRRLTNSAISGLFVNHPWAGKCILVNYDEDIFRQNFTLAHEVAHAIFDYGDQINVSTETWKAADLKEVRANAFASNFLIPPSFLTGFSNSSLSKEQIRTLALKLRVNVDPLLFALEGAKIITYSQRIELRGVRIEMSEKHDPELHGLTGRYRDGKADLFEKGLSSFYVRNCYNAYRSGFVSRGRLAEMLLCDDRELMELFRIFNFEINEY